MSRTQHNVAHKPNGVSPAAAKLGIYTKRDLAKDKNFNEKFNEFVAAHPSEQEGLQAYEALPD
jgi:hypothetical protein